MRSIGIHHVDLGCIIPSFIICSGGGGEGNLAAIWRLPTLFVCENNLYGEYTRIEGSTPIENIAERAGAYGIPSEIVDGQDVDAVHEAVDGAVGRIRSGSGPELLELKTYRYMGHVHSDAGPYRPEGELDAWRSRDPLDLFAKRLLSEDEVTQEQIDQLRRAAIERAGRAMSVVEESADPSVADMFRHIFA